MPYKKKLFCPYDVLYWTSSALLSRVLMKQLMNANICKRAPRET